MTDDELELEQAADAAFNQIKPIFTGLSCAVVGAVLSYLTANWLLSLQAEPPKKEEETETMRADALQSLALETVRLVREHEALLRNPQ